VQPELPDVEHGHLLSPLALAITATRDMPRPYVYADHLQLLSNELVRMRLRPAGWPKRLLVMMPPRHGKSEHCSHWFPTWDLALEPTDRVLLTSYEAEFAASWGRKCRRSIEEHYPILGARIVEDSRAAHRWETPQGGGMTTAGVGGPIMGRGANVAICDDPIKNAEEANSRTIRDATWDWWQSTFLTRLEPEGIVILILTRWHEDDIAGRILASPEARFWRVIEFPALAIDESDVLGRTAGQALWPARYDELALENIKAEVGSRVFTALYQQQPSPPEGAGINRAWWQWYDEAPKVEEFDQIIQSWDPTFKAVDTSDYVAGGVLGRKGGDIYALDAIRKRMNGPDTLKAIEAVDKQWPTAKWLLMEDTASGSMICDILERERGHIERVKPRGSKETRLHWGVNAAAAVIERGQVHLPRNRTWATQLVDEAAQFPHGAHDDLVDMLVQGIQKLIPRTWTWENQQERLKGAPNVTTPLQLHNYQMHEIIKRKMAMLDKKPRRDKRDFWMGGA
jgi:predicted phage terminase large subunit-like protein